MHNFQYKRVSQTHEALAARTQGHSMFVAGGTNILDLMKYNVLRPERLVDIQDLAFNVIEELPDGLRLGSLMTNADTAYNPIVQARYPLLSRAILAGASAQIRNMATNGGNLLQRTRCYYFYDVTTPCNKRDPGSGCSAIGGYTRNMAILGTSEACIAVFPSDMCVALAALDAVVEVAGRSGTRLIPFHDFHRLPGDTPHIDNTLGSDEVITAILLPSQGYQERYSYLKVRDRSSFAFALVSVATGFELEDNRIKALAIALGGVAHKPWRSAEAEHFLMGKQPTVENFTVAAAMLLDDAKGYKDNHFKIELAKRAIVRNCLMALTPEKQRTGAWPSAD